MHFHLKMLYLPLIFKKWDVCLLSSNAYVLPKLLATKLFATNALADVLYLGTCNNSWCGGLYSISCYCSNITFSVLLLFKFLFLFLTLVTVAFWVASGIKQNPNCALVFVGNFSLLFCLLFLPPSGSLAIPPADPWALPIPPVLVPPTSAPFQMLQKALVPALGSGMWANLVGLPDFSPHYKQRLQASCILHLLMKPVSQKDWYVSRDYT